jgi:hypothetical protein
MNIIFWNLSGFGLKLSFYNQRLSSRVHNLTAGQGAFLSNIHVHRFPFHNGLFWFLTLLLAFALLVINILLVGDASVSLFNFVMRLSSSFTTS